VRVGANDDWWVMVCTLSSYRFISDLQNAAVGQPLDFGHQNGVQAVERDEVEIGPGEIARPLLAFYQEESTETLNQESGPDCTLSNLPERNPQIMDSSSFSPLAIGR